MLSVKCEDLAPLFFLQLELQGDIRSDVHRDTRVPDRLKARELGAYVVRGTDSLLMWILSFWIGWSELRDWSECSVKEQIVEWALAPFRSRLQPEQ
jgi:hypothetical protein